jgi:cytochrome P450
MAGIMKSAPRDAHPHLHFTLIARKYNLGPMFAFDSWPFNTYKTLIIADPVIATQITQTRSLPKHPTIREFTEHLTGSSSMLVSEGAEWKAMRSMFNPGFSAGHLITLVPGIVDDSVIFGERLAEMANSGEIFLLEEMAARVTVDIIGKVVLDVNLNSQRTDNELVSSFRSQVNWTRPVADLNPFASLNLLRPIMNWYYGRKMDRYIERVLDERFASRDGRAPKGKRKPVIDLALDQYEIVQLEQGISTAQSGIDKAFKKSAVDQMKTFIFAGHDTSSSTICFVYHMLEKHPSAMAKLREEHDRVLGEDISSTSNKLKDNPQLLNQLPYTAAVIKGIPPTLSSNTTKSPSETLRMFAPASTVRTGDGQTPIIHDGKVYSTDGWLALVNFHTIGRMDTFYPCPDDFIPERFLPAPDNYQDITKGTWRPFELGPRACIGQELAMLEMKIILALTVRSFDISAAYEDWDRLKGRKMPGDTLGGTRGFLGGCLYALNSSDWFAYVHANVPIGYRAYQVLIASAKPAESMPARVKLRKV